MELRRAVILIYPTAMGWFDEEIEDEQGRKRDARIAMQRGHALENGIPVAAINRVCFEQYSSEILAGIRFWGSSFAFGAQGEILALGSVENEEIIYFEWDKKRTEEVRRIWPFLRDRRIDSYQSILKRFDD